MGGQKIVVYCQKVRRFCTRIWAQLIFADEFAGLCLDYQSWFSASLGVPRWGRPVDLPWSRLWHFLWYRLVESCVVVSGGGAAFELQCAFGCLPLSCHGLFQKRGAHLDDASVKPGGAPVAKVFVDLSGEQSLKQALGSVEELIKRGSPFIIRPGLSGRSDLADCWSRPGWCESGGVRAADGLRSIRYSLLWS